MFSCGNNGAISMDATFGIDYMKFYLFTFMGFGAHCTSVPLAWIITSQQTIEDLFEWLRPLKTKMLLCMPNRKLFRIIIDDAPQELKALR
jgi:hypothetical protein